MDYTYLGRTGLKISRLCLGTMNFGPETEEAESHAIMDRAHEHGINFFDTADVYGWRMGEGITEQIIGRWLAKGGGRREKTVLATKCYGEMGNGPNEAKLSALHIRRACDASLKRLQTDYIDLYQMHHVWRRAPWDEIWQAMDKLVRDGKVLYIGSSNFAAWHLMEANAAARDRKLLGIVSEQSLYNLNARMVELEVLPACRENGIAFLPWSPLAAGLLAGILQKKGKGRHSSDFVKERLVKNRTKIMAYETLCKKTGKHPATVAMSWLLEQPGVTAPVVGPRTVEQLDKSLDSLKFRVGRDLLASLDAIFPGPGGSAPEAYAW